MANELKVGVVNAIYVLLERRWPHRRIARTLGINRETVARYARRARARPREGQPADGDDSKPAKAPPGSTATGPAPEAPSPPRPPSQTSQCEPYREVIKAKLDQGLSAKRIYQDLVGEYGFEAKYHSVRRFVQRLGHTRPLPFRRMECVAGDEAQVDFGTGAPIVTPEGKRKRPHVFRIVLSHSRKGYSEAVYRQTAENFIRCLENAFWHFGGVPKTLVVDNLKAAVLKADWFDPDLNPKIESFCEHYGTVILPTKPRTPRHKGKVERGVDYVQENGLKGRTFSSLQEENAHLLDWETRIADTRIHGTTRRQVGKAFEEVERPALLPLPMARFPFFQEAQRVVSRDAHVEVDKAFYSVPPEYMGWRLWVRWDARRVWVFNHRMEQITAHTKDEPGRFRTRPEHIAPEKISGIEQGTTRLLDKAGLIGPHAQAWAESMLEARGLPGIRVLLGLTSLAARHGDEAIDQACEIALTHGAYRLRILRTLIKRKGSKQEQFEFMDEHPIIRSLSEYGDLVRHAFQEVPA